MGHGVDCRERWAEALLDLVQNVDLVVQVGEGQVRCKDLGGKHRQRKHLAGSAAPPLRRHVPAHHSGAH